MVAVGDNPLVMVVLSALRNADKPLGIHELLSAIKQRQTIPPLGEDDQVALFRLNWLLMNALYQLEQSLWQEGYQLEIQTLSIRLTALSLCDEKAQQSLTHNPLREYYLDWQNFTDTTRDDVDAILNGVWQRYLTADQQTDALAVLALDEGASWSAIRSRYRQLAAKHHPDRGGDAHAFMRVREAYEVLQKTRRQ